MFDKKFIFKTIFRRLLPRVLTLLCIVALFALALHAGAQSQEPAGTSLQDRQVRPLETSQLIRRLPVSHRICRVYSHSLSHCGAIAAALDELIGPGGVEDITNM